MGDARGWPFDSPDLIRIPFIYVPHGDPDPHEWLAEHPGAIRIPARFVPRREAEPGSSDRIEVDWGAALTKWLARGHNLRGEKADSESYGTRDHGQGASLLASLSYQVSSDDPSIPASAPTASETPVEPITEAEILKLGSSRTGVTYFYVQ